jgi:predicted dehydrogenase
MKEAAMYDGGVAITGTGFMGPAHTEGLRRLGIRVVGILGSTEEKSRRAASTLGLEKAYRSFEEILADDEVQAIHITTPNKLHHGSTRAALEAGKHVLCEKPLAMTAAESAELVQVSRQSRSVMGVCYNIRYYPLNVEARERVRRGDIGEVFHIYGGYVQDWLLYPTDYNWRVLASEGGNARAIGDIGTHWMDLVQTISGLEIEAVMADLKTVYPIRMRPQGEVETFKGKVDNQGATDEVAISTEDFGSVLLRFKGGARGVMYVSQMSAGRKNSLRWEIAGTEGALAWDQERPNELWLGKRNEPNGLLIKDPGLMSEAARPFAAYPGGHAEGYPDTFKMIFKAFYGYLAAGDITGPRPFPTVEDGHREMQLCEAILQSHLTQRWVQLDVA